MQLQRGGPEEQRERFMYTYECVKDGEEEESGGLQGAEAGSPEALEASWLCVRSCGLLHWTYLGLPTRTQV